MNERTLYGCLRPFRFAAALAAMCLMGLAGCQTGLESKNEPLGDLRPFAARSPAARQKKIHETHSVDELIEALDDENQAVVMKAVDLLGKSGDQRAAPPLVRLLNSPDPSIRYVVSEALAALGPAAVDALIRALGHEAPSVAVQAVEILSKIGDKKALTPVVGLLRNHRDGTVRASAARSLGRFGGESGVAPLIDALGENDPTVQYAAAESLAEIGEPAVDSLVAGLATAETDTATVIADVLGRIGDPSAVKPLLRYLERDLPDAVRLSVITALGAIGDPLSVQVMTEMLQTGAPVIKQRSADALVRIGPEAVPPLIVLLANDDPEIADLASGALVRIGEPSLQPLVEALEGGDAKAAWMVMDTLARTGDQRAVAPLVEKMASQEPDVAIKAAGALGVIGDPSAVPDLIGVLKNPASPARHAAADALIQVGEPAVAPLIEELFSGGTGKRGLLSDVLLGIGSPAADPLARKMPELDPKSRQLAVDLLSSLGEAAVAPLGRVLTDSDIDAGKSAAAALVRIGTPAAVRALVSGLSHWQSRKIAHNALEALGWRPADNVERIYHLVAGENRTGLLERWDMTRYILLQQLRSSRSQNRRYAALAFIHIGNAAAVPELIESLEKSGDGELARFFIASGQIDLEKAAKTWMSRRQNPYPGGTRQEETVEWGAMGG